MLPLIMAGCEVGPNFQKPEAPAVTGYLPGGDRGLGKLVQTGSSIRERWWEVFKSGALSELVELGIANSADLKAAEASVRMAQASAPAQRGALFPQVAAIWESSRQKVPVAALASDAASGAEIYSLHTAQLSVSYVFDIWGGTRRRLEAAEAAAEEKAFRREAVYLTLVSNIVVAAIQEASLRDQIATTRGLVALQEQLLGVLRRQQSLGQISLSDVLVQETALAQTRLLLPPLEKQVSQQAHLLAALTGRFPSETAANNLRLRSFHLPTTLPLSLPADLVCQRPDVRAAEANVHAASAEVGVAIANRLPQLTLTGNAGSTADAISRLFSPGTTLWAIAGNALQPVIDGGALRSRQKVAEEALVQAVEQYKGTVLVAFQNVADVLRALQADARAVAVARAANKAASRSLELARKQLEEGQASLPILLSSQQAYLQTALARVQAEATRLQSVVALFQALGGGWSSGPDAAADARPASRCHHDSDRRGRS